MNNCCKSFFSKICNFSQPYKKLKHNIKSNNIITHKNKYSSKIAVLQKTNSSLFLPQGDYKKMENYDLFKQFLSKPTVQTYINEIFLPNKEIKPFQEQKITNLYTEIQPLLNQLFTRLKLELCIPKEKYFLNGDSFLLNATPATKEELNLYSPLLFMEFWIYGKTFIKKSKLKKIMLFHEIISTDLYNDNKKQRRAGFPEYDITRSLMFSIMERNFAYIRIVLHHEFFHYIDYSYDHSFEDREWELLNQEGFEYGEGGDNEREWIKLEKNIMGFINHYSTSALEEDRAEIYQYLISCPDEALNNKDEIVAKKAKRMQNILNKYDLKGVGDLKNNFWSNLIDYRKNFQYKERLFQGNVCPD